LITSFNDLPFKVLLRVLHTSKIGFLCARLFMSLFQLLENKDTHYLLFYYSFTNMSMNSFVAYESRRVVEGGLPYITGRLGMDIVVILIIYSKRSRYCASTNELTFQ
jgi:hypothetical protein